MLSHLGGAASGEVTTPGYLHCACLLKQVWATDMCDYGGALGGWLKATACFDKHQALLIKGKKAQESLYVYLYTHIYSLRKESPPPKDNTKQAQR